MQESIAQNTLARFLMQFGKGLPARVYLPRSLKVNNPHFAANYAAKMRALSEEQTLS
jgi:hypothetical protein